jgi:aquaporin Z
MVDAERARGRDTAAALRAAALERLRQAGASRDPARFERLAWSALGLLDRARALSADAPDGPRPVPSKEEYPVFRKLAAEFLGTFWLVLGGCGSAVLAAKFPEVGIGLVGVSLAFGLTVLTMAYAIGHISGCHLNPAVTVGLVAAGRFKASGAVGYIAAQVFGAVAGAAVLYVIASGKAGFDPSAGFATNGYGAASPGGYGFAAALLTEMVMTFFFLLIILGATSDRAPKEFAPIAIGLGLTLIHLVSIPVTNTSVNPARSTGVALFGPDAAFAQLWLFWVAPIAGAVVAGLVHSWLGAEDSAADRESAVREAMRSAGEALAPAPAREPR